MNLIDELRERLKQASEKLPELKDEAVNKIKSTGDDGLEFTKRLFGDISDKITDLTSVSSLKREIAELEIQLNLANRELGKAVFEFHTKKQTDVKTNKYINSLLINVQKLKESIKTCSMEYDRIRKEHSDKYVLNKLGNEFAEAGAIIDQVLIGEKSNLIGKTLKEIVLPKQALITAIKRGPDVIIPDGSTQFQVDDLVTVFGEEIDVSKVIKRLGGQ